MTTTKSYQLRHNHTNSHGLAIVSTKTLLLLENAYDIKGKMQAHI